MLRHISVATTVRHQHIAYRNKYGYTDFKIGSPYITDALLNNNNNFKKDTFIVIFGPEQNALLEFFLKEYPCNILFKSVKARNTNHSSSQLRNTLIIFELKDDENSTPQESKTPSRTDSK